MKVFLKSGKKKIELTSRPYKLTQQLDLSGLQADVSISETTRDGGLHLGTRFGVRDVTIEGYFNTYGKSTIWIEERKKELYDLCNPKQLSQIEIEENGERFFLEAHPIAFPTLPKDKRNKTHEFQTFLLQFVCSDPFLYKNEKVVTFANITPMFSFPLTIEDPIVFGELSNSLIETIYNSGIDQSPLVIEMMATSSIKNPYLLNVYTQEKISFTTDMVAGDIIFITTGRRKEISRIRNGVKTPFYYAMDLDSTFLQLKKGDNIFRFGAEENENYLQIKMKYKEKVGGI